MSGPRSPKRSVEAAVQELGQAQGRLLSLLENSAVDLASDSVEQAAEALGLAVAVLCRELESAPDARVGFEDQLRRCANNHAVIGARLERRRESLAKDLGRTRLARRVLQSSTGSEGTGGSCDVAG